MTHDSSQILIDQLDDLLDAERTALLAGDLDQIARLLEEKDNLIDHLNALELKDKEPMAGVQEKLLRNQALLDGALQGIRRASARMAAMRRARKCLETYDEDGRKHAIEGQVLRSVEKRA